MPAAGRHRRHRGRQPAAARGDRPGPNERDGDDGVAATTGEGEESAPTPREERPATRQRQRIFYGLGARALPLTPPDPP